MYFLIPFFTCLHTMDMRVWYFLMYPTDDGDLHRATKRLRIGPCEWPVEVTMEDFDAMVLTSLGHDML